MRALITFIVIAIFASNIPIIAVTKDYITEQAYSGIVNYFIKINDSFKTITDYEKIDNTPAFTKEHYSARQKIVLIEPSTGSEDDIKNCKPDDVIKSIFSDEYSLRGHVSLIEKIKDSNTSYYVCKYDFSSSKYVGKITDCLGILYKKYDYHMISNKIKKSVSYEQSIKNQYNEAVNFEIKSAVLKNIIYRIKVRSQSEPFPENNILQIEFISGLDELEGISIFDRIISMRMSLEKSSQKLREACLLAQLSDEEWLSYYKHINNL